MTVTPAQFKAAKPQFAAVADATVQSYLDMAVRFSDDTWGTDQDLATISITCHMLTLDGLGTDPASVSYASGGSQYQSIRSGQLTLTRYASNSAGDGTYGSWLAQTQCGQFYAILLRMNRGGPRVAYGGVGCGPSPYAKDWLAPVYGWPGIFY